MEVLSVQNQYQGQFGVIGSSKVKDLTSPLTPPPPPRPAANSNNHTTSSNVTTAAHNQRNQQQQQRAAANRQQQQQQQTPFSLPPTELDYDVVDGGRASKFNQPHLAAAPPQQHSNHQQQQQHPKQHHYYHDNHHYGVTHYQQQHPSHYYGSHKAAGHWPHQHQQHYQQQQLEEPPIMEAVPAEPTVNGDYAFNNNLFCYDDPTTLVATGFGSACNEIDVAAVNELAQRVQTELRAAKSRHLACTEVSLPYDLMPRIAEEIIKVSEREPCGVRGCTLYIDFEDEPNNVRRIASFQVDPDTVSTFELYLTLKQDKSGWTSLLPQFLKNLTRSNTIMISPAFTLTKNKLYACE